MSARKGPIEALAGCSFEGLIEEALQRLYERRLEIDTLLRNLEGKRQQGLPRASQPSISQSIREEDLRHAIERQQLVVYYQPKVSLRLRQLVGFEALVHWNDPKRGLLPPAEFVPFAESKGLMVPLGSWVLSQASRQLSLWRQEISRASPLTMEVSLSHSQLESDSPADQVKSCLLEYKLPPEALQIALTKASVQQNPELALRCAEELNRLNVRVWLDGAALGTYPPSQLHRYPLSGLKIDSSSLLQTERSHSAAMTNAIFALSRKLGFRLIADEIETVEEADELERLGCEFGQGALFSTAVPAGAATRFILADSFGLLGRSKHSLRRLSNSSNCPPTLLA